MRGSRRASEKMKNVAKPNPSPSVATVTEPVLAKSFPSNSSQHAVEPQSPPMTPPKGTERYHSICSWFVFSYSKQTQDHEVLHPNTSNQIARPHALLYSLAAARRQPVNKNSCKDKKVHLHSRPSQAHYQWYDRHFSTLANWVLFPVCRAVDQQVHHDSRYPPEFKRRWFSVSPW